jgi:protein-disulfide isomerase
MSPEKNLMIKNLFNLATFAALSVALSGSGTSAAPPVVQTQLANSLEQQRQAILEDPIAPRVEPRGYDVTIIEYMDYQCPYCRASHGPLKQLLATDRKVRIIYRDWPIFGPASERAARLAIASQWQGKHAAFHDALMTTPQPLSEAKIRSAAKMSGVNWSHLGADLKAHSTDIEALLKRNADQAELLGLEGTPGFIIGNVQSFGGMSLAQLQEAVSKARHDRAHGVLGLPQQPVGL